MYARILIPTDGSECSDAAVAEGVRLAKQLGSRVAFLYVVDLTPFARDVAIDVDRILREEGRSADEVLARARAAAESEGVPSETRVTEGLAASEIERASLENDLVVIGSHGRGWLARAVLGSTTQAVLNRAKRPVLVLRRAARQA